MLLLLFKNAMWAAWWPYYTMVLAMEKAATQAAANRPKSVGSTAVSDAFMQAEIPPALRELMKMSIEQAKRAFEAFVTTSEQAWKSLETSAPGGRAGLFALNAKIVEIIRLNAEANFALAAKLAEAKDLAQAIELQSRHVRAADGHFRAPVGGDARPRRADHPAGKSGGPDRCRRQSGLGPEPRLVVSVICPVVQLHAW